MVGETSPKAVPRCHFRKPRAKPGCNLTAARNDHVEFIRAHLKDDWERGLCDLNQAGTLVSHEAYRGTSARP